MTAYSNTKHHLLSYFPVLLFIFNFCSKLAYATHEPIGLDEPFSIYHAQFDVPAIIAHLKNYNNPPLYELILHVWIGLFGISPLAVRFLALVFAALGPVALFYFGKRFFSVRVAVVSSALLSVSALLFYYSHDCRVYSLFMLLSILSMHFFLQLLVPTGKKDVYGVLFVTISTLLIYSHYFGMIVLFIQAIHLLLFCRKRILAFTVYYGGILLLYLPHLYTVATRVDAVKGGTWLGPPSGIESMYNMLWSFTNYPFITVTVILLLTGAGLKFLIEKNFSAVNKNHVLILLWFLLPFAGMFVISYRVPMYISRYLIFALPAYYLLVAAGVDYLFAKTLHRNLLSGFLFAAFACTVKVTDTKKRDIGPIVDFISQHKSDSTLVVVCPFDFLPTFAYHYNKQYFSAIENKQEYRSLDSLQQAAGIYFVYGAVDFKSISRTAYDQIIYIGVGDKSIDPNHPLLKLLHTTYKLRKRQNIDASCRAYVFE